MPVISCYCNKCGKNFFMRDEMYIPIKKVRFSLREPTEEPKTWEEWLIHISAFCEECRNKEIPEKVWHDYIKLKGD